MEMETREVTDGNQALDGTQAGGPALLMTGVSIAALRHSDRVVFEEVNWSVATGDFWAIAGLHGCGKTDFMTVAAGLNLPVRGAYWVFGRELGAGFERDLLETRRRLGLVFDGGRVLRHLTVAENVGLPICYHRDQPVEEAAVEIDRLLALTGLSVWADQPTMSLSRNWQQRVGLARALALQPEVLLVDNPLSGLDPRDAAWWLAFLSQLAAGHPDLGGRPMTLVVSCDDLRPWQGRARQFAVLRDRRLVPLGSGLAPLPDDDFLRASVGAPKH